MNIELTEISESDYKSLTLPVLFEDKLTDRVFGVISNGRSKYKLGWQSTGMRPVVTMINSVHCSIGIDQTFVIVDFDKRDILMRLPLDYFFYDTKKHNGFLYVITELEIIKISITNVTVNETYALPDYFESIEFKEGVAMVKCFGGEVINIE